MTTIFDYLDAADPWALIAIVFLLLYILEAIGHRLAHRTLRILAALERIEGYAHGYRDGVKRALPAVHFDGPTDVPDAFLRETYRGA